MWGSFMDLKNTPMENLHRIHLFMFQFWFYINYLWPPVVSVLKTMQVIGLMLVCGPTEQQTQPVGGHTGCKHVLIWC